MFRAFQYLTPGVSLKPIVQLSSLAILGWVGFFASPAQAEKPLTKAEIVALIKSTVRSNPQVIIDALQAHENQAQTEKQKARAQLIEKNYKALYHDGYSLEIGNPKADVTIISFKDHRCGYCKKSWEIVKQLVKEDKNIKVILKEYPILGPSSMIASQFSLAAKEQGKYQEYYDVLMSRRGAMEKSDLIAEAKKLGLDVEKLEKDAQSDKIKKQLNANRDLGAELEIFGTPAFIIDNQIIEGAAPKEAFKQLIAERRKLKK